MFSAVGGSMLIFAGAWPRMLPSDFRVRSLDGVADDWPLDVRRAAPVLRAHATAQFGVSGMGGDPAYPPGGEDPPLPPLPDRGRRAQGGPGAHAARLALVAGAELDPVRRLRRAPPVRAAGHVPAGLHRGREGVDRPDPLAEGDRRGARLVTGARVRRPRDERRRAGHRGEVGGPRRRASTSKQAEVVVLAANAIGTPRLLLLSASPGIPDGLANSSGLVGRRLMMHPFANVAGLFDEDLESWQGQFGCSIESFEFYETDERRGFVRGAKWGLAPTFGPINAALPEPGRVAGVGPRPSPARALAPRARRQLGPVRRGPARRGQPR